MHLNFLIPICESFEKGKCRSRLSVYIEKSKDERKAIVESANCPFYRDGNCIINGMIDCYTLAYYYKLSVYEKKDDELEELKRPLPKPVLRKEWEDLLRT